jgi:hypothetical protein
MARSTKPARSVNPLCPPDFISTSQGCIYLKQSKRFQFIKRGLGQSDFFTQALAQKCADPQYWGGSSDCQALFPGGWDEAGAAAGTNCVPNTSSYQAKIDDLKQNWRPTGIYTPDDLDSIVGKVMGMINVQQNTALQFQTTYDTSYLDSVRDQLIDFGKQAIDYLAATRDARARGVAVKAPGLRVWVITAMETIVDGMKALGVAACGKPFWLDALGAYDSAIADVWGVAKAIGGVAIELAKDALIVIEQAFGFAAWLAKWAPLLFGSIVVGGVGYGFYRWNKRTRRFPSLLPPG